MAAPPRSGGPVPVSSGKRFKRGISSFQGKRIQMGVAHKTLKVKNVLISQPAPADLEKSPYKPVADKFGLKLVFKKLFQVEGIPAVEFRKNKINLLDYSGVVLTSRNAVDHYFRMAKEMRAQIPITMKFFCSSESVAFYIQTYIQYRKRKIFYGKQTTADLMEVVLKHKEEKFIFPCSEDSNSDVPAAFAKAKIPLKRAPMYRSVFSRVADEIRIEDFDMVLMFSPMGVKSLFENYPGFKQGKLLVGTFGLSVAEAACQSGLAVNLAAPTPTASSMAQALDEFLSELHKNSGDVEKTSQLFGHRVQQGLSSAKASRAVRTPAEMVAVKSKGIESKVAANKAAALAVIAGKKGGRSMVHAQK